MALPAPIEQFGKYQILERIARGGMAEIFKARMEGIGGFHRLYAIKRILPSLSTNRDYIDMLVDEAKIAGLLSHANIVQILDLGQVDGQYYVAMELVDGPDLGQILERCRQRGITLPVPQAVFVLIEVLKGLEYAHKRQILRGNKPVPLNIVHRDVSPSNVLVSLQGEVKLTDFGIAKANVKALETLSGVIKGKFDYMSPEQASGEDVDPRTDLFAAGVLFYELLCGTHPFHQKSEIKTIEAIRRGEYTPPSAVNAVVDYPLEVIIDRALARDREARYATATEFKDALNRYAHDAGFIFTPATLAGFLKGLFPESAKLKRTPTVTSLRDQETRPLPVNGGPLVEDDEDRSTDHSGKAPPPNAGRDDTITRTNLGPPLRPPAPAPAPAQPVAARPAPPAPQAPPRPAAPPRPPAPAAPAGVGVTPRLNTAPPAARPVAAAPAAPAAPARPPAAPIAPPPAESPPTRPPSRLPPRRTRDVAPSGFFDPRMFGEEQDPLSPGAPPQKIPEGLSGRRNLAGATPPAAAAPAAPAAAPQRAPSRPVQPVDDEATLRRSIEDLAREDEWSGEVATLIRNRPGAVTAAAPKPAAPTPPPTPPPPPSKPVAAPARPAPPPPAAPRVVAKVTPEVDEELVLDDPTANVPGGATQLTKALAEKAPAPKKAAAPAPKKAAAEPPPPERSILGPVALALVAGMMVGGLVGGLAGGLLGAKLFSATVAAPPVALPAPMLRLSVPPGSKVTLDGEALILNNKGEAERALIAGAPATLRVEPVGGAPSEETLTPQEGQVWVVQVVPSALSPKDSKR